MVLVDKILEAAAFSFLGIIMLWFVYFLFDKLTPGDLSKEIGEKNNLSLAITVSAVLISLALIISAAIHG